jgi:hypothetical protein
MNKILILAKYSMQMTEGNNNFSAASCMLFKHTITYAQPLVHTMNSHKKKK